MDNADIQWREFREALPLLVGAAVALVVVVRLFNSWTSRSQVAVGSNRYVVGAQIRLVIGLLFLIVVHGVGAVFSLALVGIFVVAARTLAGTRAAIPTAWALTLLAIVAKEERLPLRRYITFSSLGGQSLRFLDRNSYQGLYEWTHSVNLMLLRLVSFAIDYHYAVLHERDGVLPQATPEVGANASASGKSSGAASQPQSPLQQIPVRDRYSFVHCLSHTFYAPLFIAGPTIGFTDFLEQCHTPRQSKTHVVWYIVRLAGAMLTLEMGTHLYPCFALARSGLIGKLGPRLGAAAVFLTLNLMWLKFLVVWRVASAWALAEGIAVPENMRRALCNHFSIAGFWKCWHASFNRWLVKYLYIPVGGRDNRVLAALLTFLFVALWHDIEAKLLAWGLLNAGFVALETAASGMWRKRGAGLAVTRPWVHRQLGALGGTTYIIILMGINMVGYSIGIGGASALLEQSADEYLQAIWVLLGAYAVLFSGVQVMIELRKLDGTTPRATAGISQSADGPTGEATGMPADDTKRD